MKLNTTFRTALLLAAAGTLSANTLASGGSDIGDQYAPGDEGGSMRIGDQTIDGGRGVGNGLFAPDGFEGGNGKSIESTDVPSRETGNGQSAELNNVPGIEANDGRSGDPVGI